MGFANQKKERVHLEAGGARVYAVCSGKQFNEIYLSAIKTKIENESVIVDILLEKARRDGVNIEGIRRKLNSVRKKLCQTLKVTEYKDVLDKIIELKFAVGKVYLNSENYPLIQKIEHCRRTLGQIHRILSDKLEAPRIVMGRHLPNPFPVLTQPGHSYAKNGLLLSLVFKKICEMREKGKIRETRNMINLLADEADSFLIQCQKNLQMHNPAKATMKGNSRTAMIEFISPEYWQRKLAWLDKDNGIPLALSRLKNSQK